MKKLDKIARAIGQAEQRAAIEIESTNKYFYRIRLKIEKRLRRNLKRLDAEYKRKRKEHEAQRRRLIFE